MRFLSDYCRRIQDNLPKLAGCLQPRYLIYTIALSGLADIALSSTGDALTGIVGVVGGTLGIEMLGHLLTKLEKNEPVLDSFLVDFCKALDESDIERWLSRSELHGELDQIARIIGTALQYHENVIVSKVLDGVSYFENLRSKTIEELGRDIIDRFDPEKRYLASLIHRCESRDGVREYVSLQGEITVKQDDIKPKMKGKRRVIDSALAVRSNRKKSPKAPPPEEKKEPIENIREIIDRHKCFVLLGNPGSGKTTTLRRLAVDMAWTRLSDPDSPIPLFLELPQWKDQTLYDFLESGWNLELDLSAAIVEGKVWIFLDGLNEMGKTGSEKAKDLRTWLNSRNRPEYFIATCRTKDYRVQTLDVTDGHLDLGITTAEVSALDSERIREFCVNYLGEETADGFLKYIFPLDEVEDRPNRLHLFPLAQNPFMMRALLLIFEESPNSSLPSNMGKLFQDLIEQLWVREKQRNTIGWIDLDLMLNQLSDLAFTMIQDDLGTYVSFELVERFIDSGTFEAMERANLIEVVNNQIRFYHQMMQEFFAAVKLKTTVDRIGFIPAEIIRPDNIEQIDLRMFDLVFETGIDELKSTYPLRWGQVIVALCGISDDTDRLILEIAEKNPFLVIDCILSGVSISKATSKIVEEKLLDFMSNTDYWGLRLWVALDLSRYGFAPQSIEQKVSFFVSLMDWEKCCQLGVAAVPTLLKIAKQWDNEYYYEGVSWCLTMLGALDALLEIDWEYAYDLAEVLGENALSHLYPGLEHWDSYVREISAELLGNWADPDSVPRLIQCLQDTSWFVAKAAAHSLWRIGTSESLKAAELFWRNEQGKERSHVWSGQWKNR